MPPARTSSKPAAKRKNAAKGGRAAPKARARRSSSSWRPRLPVIEQRHLDLAGLALVAAGVFLAFPLYLRWDGGAAGQPVVDGLTWALGTVAYAIPVALVAAGALIVMSPVLPAVRPFRAGAICLLGSALLLFGAGGDPVRENGGVVGRALHDTAASAFSDVGASIIAIFLAVAATLLLTGASVAGVLSATHTARRRDHPRSAPRAPPRRGRRLARGAAGRVPVLRAARAGGRGAGRAPAHVGRDPRRRAALPGPLRLPGRDRDHGAAAAGARARAAGRGARGRSGARAGHPARAAARGPGGRAGARDGGRRARAARPRAAGRRPGVRPARAADPQALDPGAGAARHGRPGADRRSAHRGARPSRRPGAGHRRGRRPAHHPLRAPARAGREDGEGREPQERPRLRARRDRDPDPRADPGQARGRRRGPQPPPPHRHPRRRARGRPARVVAAHRLARQGRQRQGDQRRPRQDAAPPRRRHDGRGQVGLRQRDAELDPPARDARRGAPRPRRPQAGRAQPLRGDPAPADPGHHEPADGGERAAEPRARDGVALRRDVGEAHALAGRAQQGAREGGRQGAAVHPVRHRRARRPDDGRAGRRRGLDHPPRPEGARGRHPPRARDAEPAGRRHHRA